jgi:hypothetical protein
MSKTAKFTFAGKQYSLLSRTSAMSCYSFSLPAAITCPGKVDNGPQSICHGCYGQLGCYNFKTTLNAQAARFAWTISCLKHNRGFWIDTMAAAIRNTGERHFRWHDSGDIFSPEYCRMIMAVCWRTPNVKHWIPTRSWHLPWIDVIRQFAALPNVIVRPSALGFDDPAPKVEGLDEGTTAINSPAQLPEGHRLCPKTTADHKSASCESVGCRGCWENSEPVAYLVHGRRAMHRVHHATEKESNNRREACHQALAFVSVEALTA